MVGRAVIGRAARERQKGEKAGTAILRCFALRGNPFSGNCGCWPAVGWPDNDADRLVLSDTGPPAYQRGTHGSRNGNGSCSHRHVRGQRCPFLLQDRALTARFFTASSLKPP